MKPRVLVVDDEQGIRRGLERGLAGEGMEVVGVGDGVTALRAARTGTFDALVLDVMLPGLSGYEVLKQMRAAGVWTPVVMLSAKDTDEEQADGLDLGADGYVTKPFAFVVLVAQLKAALRRGETNRGPIRVGGLVIDRAKHAVSWEDRPMELSPREFDVLAALAGRAGSLVRKKELLVEVWGDEEVTSNTVEQYVGYVRRKLVAAGADGLLQTVRGHGYLVDVP
ncbi:DNA-binding response regulator [Pseudonocardiaceae bacterium YIM PH 21723]|nr:DNA-binding response regulator [Pseudonocardiaceae bacterium YIM PH 21723]